MESNYLYAPAKQNFGAGARISFIIVNYKSYSFLKNCLNSIHKNSGDLSYEIIIVNNDDVALDFPGIETVNLKKNIGFGAGCNAGAKIAQGEILCFLNPDTEILDNIKKIINYFGTDNNMGVIGPKLITRKNKTQQWCAGAETNLWNILRNNLGFPRSKKIWNSQKPVECSWVSGAALFIKKNIFNEARGFDENFFMYYEDEDLCKRVREKGYKIIYFPEFTVRHLCGKSFNSRIKQKKYFYTSMIYYFKKHFWKNKA